MLKKQISILIGLLLLVSFTYAGKVKCPNVVVILDGTKPAMMGSTYHEHLEMHKISGGPGYNGKWKVDLFRSVISYAHNIGINIHTNKKINFGNNNWMQCKSVSPGNQVISNCTGGNLILDVYKNRVGSHQTNIWIGKIKGKQVSIRFIKNSELGLTITGTIKEMSGGELDLNIITPSGGEKLLFNDTTPGILEIELKAKVTPKIYEADIVWEIPNIGNSVKTVEPPSARGPSILVQYKGLPKNNSNFGKKSIKVKVDAGACSATDTKEVSIFFPRDAKNNPASNDPNWFYYWSQTSARKGPAKFGDPANACGTGGNKTDNTLGYYRNEILDSVYYICDLKKLGDKFPFKSAQWGNNNILISTPVEGIDTFAAACWHENAHYTHFKWWFPYKADHPKSNPEDVNKNSIKDSKEVLLDIDQDLLLDTKEPSMNLDPTTRYTYPGPYDDEEIAAWHEEAEWTIGGANKEDWAVPGKQWP